MATQDNDNKGPLSDLKVLDLTRILAGPTATQLLGDMGAEIIKVERPGKGDDTRSWGPPFLTDAQGDDTSESAYYLCANRNKRSVAIDIASQAGQQLIRDLATRADIVIENFKIGTLTRYGLDYECLSAINPKLIFCSITGFGQTGPLAHRPGYDFMIQGMGGIMSLSGFADEDGGEPTKTGVGIADVMCGMYATAGILGALHARQKTGRGQYIDLALFDSQIAWLINQGAGYLVSGEVPPRRGNDHPTIVPYGTFPAADRSFIIAVGNDSQFARLCKLLDAEALALDPLYAKNVDRVRNRQKLTPLLRQLTIKKTADEWLALMDEHNVPGGPINDLEEVFSHPQTVDRQMKITMAHPMSGSGEVDLIGNPLKFSSTPVSYRRPPPVCGQHTFEVLGDWLDLGDDVLETLVNNRIIQNRDL